MATRFSARGRTARGEAESSRADAWLARAPEEAATFTVTGSVIQLAWALSDIAPAGDVNGDGIGDYVVGSGLAYNQPPGSYPGAAWILFGRAGDVPATIDIVSEGWPLLGSIADNSEIAGAEVAGAGDFDGDGFADVAVVARRWPADPFRAVVYIVYGEASGFSSLTLADMAPGDGMAIVTLPASSQTVTVSGVRDVNGDGIDDIVIGNPGDDGGGDNAGAAWLVLGDATRSVSLQLDDDLGSRGFKLTGDVAGDFAGAHVSGAGDFNGDGLNDFLVGAPGSESGGLESGVAYLIYGSSSSAPIDLGALVGRGFRIIGPGDFRSMGHVGSAGDVNGDGYDDIIVMNASQNSGAGTDLTRAYLIFGSAIPSAIDLDNLPASGGFLLTSSQFLREMAAGDINGDGFDDILFASDTADFGFIHQGAIYVLYGRASGFGTVDLDALEIPDGVILTGSRDHDRLGYRLSVGDVNADGFADILTDRSGRGEIFQSPLPAFAVHRTGTVADQTLAGSNFDDVLDGREGNDELYGNGGNDSLEGGLGADDMRGGAGDDLYFVDDAGDTVTEAAGGGTDTVRTILGSRADPAAAAYVLPPEVEILIGTLGSAQLLEDNASNNVITTGNGADFVYAMHGGVDTVSTGGGNDFLFFGATFTTADAIDGGAGTDRLGLYGDYALTFGAGSLTGIERLMLYSAPGNDFDYSLATVDANVAAGAQLEVAALSLGAGEVLTFNGAAETDGSFWVRSGGGDDLITGGALGDRISGGLGADRLTGGGGADRFDVTEIAHSTGVNFDTFVGFDPNVDRINISGTVSQWGVGGMSGLTRANFDAELAAIVDDVLEAHGAARATATSGEFAGKIFVVVDGNGDGAYTAGADYVFAFENPAQAMLQAFPIFT